jgi:hypothetical protein
MEQRDYYINGEKVTLSSVTGCTQYICDGRMISRQRPTFEGLKAIEPTLIEVKAGEKIGGSSIYFTHLTLVTEEGEKNLVPARRELSRPVFIEMPYIRIDIGRFVGAKGRPAKLRERVNQGSIIRVKAGTRFGDRSLPLSKRSWYPYDRTRIITEDLLIYVTREDEGKVIDESGKLADKAIRIKSHLGIDCPAGWGIVQDVNGLEIIHKGDQTISHSISACM